MRIKIEDLRSITEKIFDHLKDINVEFVDLDKDYYWDIPEENAYDVTQEPSSHMIGQLSDDWDDLKKIIQNAESPLAYDLVDLAAILKAIGFFVSK